MTWRSAGATNDAAVTTTSAPSTASRALVDVAAPAIPTVQRSVDAGQADRRVRRVAHDPLHADEVGGPVRVLAREVRRHRVSEGALRPRVDPDLGWHLRVAGEPAQRELREREALVGGRHRGDDVGSGEVSEGRNGWHRHSLWPECRAADAR
jgi:hypothetical protein